MSINKIGYATIIAGTLLLSCCSKRQGDNPSTMNETVSEYVDSCQSTNHPEMAKTIKPAADVSFASPVLNKPSDILNDAWTSVMEKDGYKVKLTPKFFQQVIDFSRKNKLNAVDLTFIMFQESKFQSTERSSFGSVGLLQMDKTSFNNCALKMFEYEKYKKDNPDKDITLRDYLSESSKGGFKKPDIGKDRITFEQYSKLSPEKQFKYTEAYIKYRIHEKGLNGKKIPSNQLWALIHRPTDYDKSTELNGRARLLNVVKNGGTFGKSKVKGVREISARDFYRIIKSVK